MDDNNGNRLISSNRIFLRRFLLSDAADIYRILSDPRVIEPLGRTALSSVEDATEYLKRNYIRYYVQSDNGMLSDMGLPLDYRFAICLSELGESEKLIGRIGIASSGDTNNLGFYIDSHYWGRGYAPEAASLVARLAREGGFKYLTGRCERHNRRSGYALIKSGMTYRYSWKSNDEIYDFYQLDLTDEVRTYWRFWDENPAHWIEDSIGDALGH